MRGAALGRDRYELQLLYGVRPRLQQRLVDDGHPVRLYVPVGADWYGYCEADGDVFKFEVGNDDVNHISSATDFYLLIKGIEGPATEGIWKDSTTKAIKDDPNLRTTFSVAQFKNVNMWTFGPEDANDGTDDCYVELFGPPAEGELTPSQQTFSHFVKIYCSGLDNVMDSDGNGFSLNTLEVEIYFDDCN